VCAVVGDEVPTDSGKHLIVVFSIKCPVIRELLSQWQQQLLLVTLSM